ncbi:MAG: hypothetical protein ABR903_10600, partial [Thermodesulfovibrionales bacterium]
CQVLNYIYMGTLLMVKTLNYIELSNGYVVFMMNLTGNVGLGETPSACLRYRSIRVTTSNARPFYS